jgi:hypothetical protein
MVFIGILTLSQLPFEITGKRALPMKLINFANNATNALIVGGVIRKFY